MTKCIECGGSINHIKSDLAVRPITFEIDITGVNDLRIVSNGDYGYLLSCGFLLTNGFMVSE